jgi:hypothetical protein
MPRDGEGRGIRAALCLKMAMETRDPIPDEYLLHYGTNIE